MKHFIKTFSCILVAALLIGEPTFAALPSEDILDMFNSNNVFYYNPSGSDDLCGYSMTRLSGNTIAEKVWNYFINQGFTDAQVAGILGNAKAESSVEPTRSSNGNYFGLFQWGGGRKNNLFNKLSEAGLQKYTQSSYWASGASQNIPATDLDKILQTELDFAMSETSYNWISEIKKQDSPEAAAEAFLALFERAVDGDSAILYYEPYQGLLYQGTTQRRNYAHEFYEQYSGKGISAGTGFNFENGKNLTIFGDSITVASTNALLAQFPDLTANDIYAQNGRKWYEAVNIARGVTNMKDNVVFALGANSPSLTTEDITEAIDVIGTDKNIVFVTDWSTENEYTSNNALFFEFAKNNSNIVVADWNKIVKGKANEYLFDWIHPNSTGARLFAENIYNALNSNTTSNGCLVNGEFTQLVKAYAWPEHHQAPFTNRMPSYANAVSRSISEGRYVGGSINGIPGIDCGGFVTILMQNSGLAPDYNDTKGNTNTQEQWVKSHNWTLLNSAPNRQVDTSILQPGDVAFTNGHTFIYVGEISGFHSKIASASYGQSTARAPMAGFEDLLFGNGAVIRWYRNPNYSAGSNLNYRNNLQNNVWSNN